MDQDIWKTVQVGFLFLFLFLLLCICVFWVLGFLLVWFLFYFSLFVDCDPLPPYLGEVHFLVETMYYNLVSGENEVPHLHISL